MKKFLLVAMIGLVLVMDLYGIVNQIMVEEIEDIDHIDHIEETTVIVYVE